MIPVLNPASLNSFMVSRRFIGLGAPGSNILAISSFSVENEKDIMTPQSSLSSNSLGKIATSFIPFKISISLVNMVDLVKRCNGNLKRFIIPNISLVNFRSFSTVG